MTLHLNRSVFCLVAPTGWTTWAVDNLIARDEGWIPLQVEDDTDVDEEERYARYEYKDGIEYKQINQVFRVEDKHAFCVAGVRVVGHEDERTGGDETYQPQNEGKETRIGTVEDLLNLI